MIFIAALIARRLEMICEPAIYPRVRVLIGRRRRLVKIAMVSAMPKISRQAPRALAAVCRLNFTGRLNFHLKSSAARLRRHIIDDG